MSDRAQRQVLILVTTAFVLSFLWSSFRCLAFCEVYKPKLVGSTHECCIKGNEVPTVTSTESCPCESLAGSLDRESSGLTQSTQKFDQRPAAYQFEAGCSSS